MTIFDRNLVIPAPLVVILAPLGEVLTEIRMTMYRILADDEQNS